MRSSLKQRLFEWLRRREVYAQDKFAGIAQMAEEISNGYEQYLSPDFIMHINELTLLVQGAGVKGIATTPTTTFKSLGPIPRTQRTVTNYKNQSSSGLLERLIGNSN